MSHEHRLTIGGVAHDGEGDNRHRVQATQRSRLAVGIGRYEALAPAPYRHIGARHRAGVGADVGHSTLGLRWSILRMWMDTPDPSCANADPAGWYSARSAYWR